MAKCSGLVVCAEAQPPSPQGAGEDRGGFIADVGDDVADDGAFHGEFGSKEGGGGAIGHDESVVAGAGKGLAPGVLGQIAGMAVACGKARIAGKRSPVMKPCTCMAKCSGLVVCGEAQPPSPHDKPLLRNTCQIKNEEQNTLILNQFMSGKFG